MSDWSGFGEASRHAEGARMHGVSVGIVTDIADEDHLGRVKVRFPTLMDESGNEVVSDWVRVATLMGGPERGTFFIPQVGDEVLVAFEHGNMQVPYVIGALWNGEDKPPIADDKGPANLREIRSVSGHRITLDDTDGAEKIIIVDRTGKNTITFDSAENRISIASDADIQITCKQGKLVIEAKELTLKTDGEAKIEAAGKLVLKGATVDIN